MSQTFSPIIPNFRSTNLGKAFTLNAIVTSLISFTAVISRDLLSNKIKKKVYVYLTTIAITFVSALICYGLMYFLFGYGGGMLSSPIQINILKKRK
jgi:hypothetical protein